MRVVSRARVKGHRPKLDPRFRVYEHQAGEALSRTAVFDADARELVVPHSVDHKLACEVPDRRSTPDRLALQYLPRLRINSEARRPVVGSRLAGVQTTLSASPLSIEPSFLRGDRALEPPSERCGLKLGVTQRRGRVCEFRGFSDLATHRRGLGAHLVGARCSCGSRALSDLRGRLFKQRQRAADASAVIDFDNGKSVRVLLVVC